VYISRRDATDRHVRNEEELLSVISELGFSDYALTEYSFSEQVELFAQAECIVGPMGAGFTNMMFAEDPTVVMLFGSDHNACYFTMAQGLGYDFGYIRGTPIGGDLRVDPEDLHQFLRKHRDLRS
jgi:capsular polysaccharide biosynthesis protein